MKRFFTTMLASMMTFVGVMAQLNIWYNGTIVYQRDYTLIDSITFSIQNPTPSPDITDNLPTMVENMIGSPDNAVRSTLQTAGYSIHDQYVSNEELFLTFVNNNEDTIICVFRQSNLLTDVNAIMHFSSGSLPLNIYKDWSATAYALASWQNWNGYIRELPQSNVQYFSGRTLFTSVLNSLSTANYVAEECTYDRDNYASLSFLKSGLISRIEYARAFRHLDVVPTAISLPDTINVDVGYFITIPYDIQPHGAELSYITATTDDPSVAEVDGTRLIGNNVGHTVLRVLCGSIQKSVVVICQDPLVEGMYIFGAATAVASLKAENRNLARMAKGMNEATKSYRTGMYEKYIALEANQPFQLFLHKLGMGDVTYGADLVSTVVETDWSTIESYTGNLIQNGSMQVPLSGLYHVVVDLNLDGQLNAAKISIVPCEWGVRGAMNGWNYTAMSASAFNKTQMTYTITDAIVHNPGQFKFAHGNYWKFYIDMTGVVVAETALGSDANDDGGAYTKIVVPGRNFPIVRGMHAITLTWNLNGGETGDSFTFVDTKTAEIETTDYSTCGVELVGNAVADQQGAFPDDVWNWGNRMSMGTPVQNGYVYTWTINAYMVQGEFKIRSSRYQEGGIWAFDYGDGYANLVINTDGYYQITFTINAETGEKHVDVVAATL